MLTARSPTVPKSSKTLKCSGCGLRFFFRVCAVPVSSDPQDDFGYERQGSHAALDRPPNSPVPPKRVLSDIISFRRVALDAPDGMPLVRGRDMGGGRGGEGGSTHVRVCSQRTHIVW